MSTQNNQGAENWHKLTEEEEKNVLAGMVAPPPPGANIPKPMASDPNATPVDPTPTGTPISDLFPQPIIPEGTISKDGSPISDTFDKAQKYDENGLPLING